MLDEVFLILFEKEVDRDGVQDNGPWLFSKQVILTTDLPSSITVTEVDFPDVVFWIHLHGLPQLGFTDSIDRGTGDRVGEVLEVDTKRRKVWRVCNKEEEYMRIRVKLKVNESLPRGVFMSVGGKNRRWVYFQYERLPNFCCGKLGHMLQECDATDSSVSCNQYREWMKTSSDVKHPMAAGVVVEGQSRSGNVSCNPRANGEQREPCPKIMELPIQPIPILTPTNMDKDSLSGFCGGNPHHAFLKLSFS